MARLPYVKPGASADADRAFTEVGRLGRPILNLYAELANQPPALEAFLEMSKYVRSGSSLEPGLRELSILATAHAIGQDYEIKHHTEAALAAGVPEEKIAATAPGAPHRALDARERCAVDFAREAAASRTCSNATFRRLESVFTTQEIVDLVVTAGWYHLCAVILGTFKVEPET